jgi:FAD/FMN-containing dehydrogenase
LDRLRAFNTGKLLLPGSADYEWARRPFIARFDEIAPQAVARCAAAENIAEALAFAAKFGLDVAARSGGHDLAGRSSTRGVLLDVTPLDMVAVTGRRVTVGAGVRTGVLCERLSSMGSRSRSEPARRSGSAGWAVALGFSDVRMV